MAKKPIKKLKLIIPAGRATPAPPIGPTLGQAKINIGEFVSKFNEASKPMMGETLPVTVLVYEDRTYDMILKTPTASSLILKAAGKEKGSGKNAAQKAGSVTRAQVREIAEKKLKDLNANDIEAGAKIIEGSARSMGIDVK